MKFLIILDLNGVLLDRARGSTGTKPDFVVNGAKCYLRPGVHKFLKWLHHRFDVAVWSSTMPHNTIPLVKKIWGKRMNNLRFIFTQNQCTYDGMMGKKPILLKDLQRVWDIMPWYDKLNTILIDDSPYKSINNPSYTCYHPTTYSRETNEDMTAIQVYLERLVEST